MRRFAVAWETQFPADTLADLVAALEGLLVPGGNALEAGYGYRLRVRTAHFLATTPSERKTISKDVRAAYDYRSRIDHGVFVLDRMLEWPMANKSGKLPRTGNVFADLNEIQRLIRSLRGYYMAALSRLIASRDLTPDWERLGL